MLKVEIQKNVMGVFFPVSIIILYIIFLLGGSGQVLPTDEPVTVIGAIISKLHGEWQSCPDSCYLVRMKTMWTDNAYLPVLMPVVCGMPGMANYMEELAANNKKLILVRSSARTYYISKIIANIISSALIAVFAVALYYITLAVFYDHVPVTDDSFNIIYFVLSGIFPEETSDISVNVIYYIIIKGILLFMLYAIISGSFSMLSIVFCKDKYVTTGFIISFCYMQNRIIEELEQKYLVDGIVAAGTASDIINPEFLYFAGYSGFYKDKEILALVLACVIIVFNYFVFVQYSSKQFDISEH